MKYIKEYINFDEWDDEEENNSILDEFIGHEDFYNFLVDNNALDNWVKNVYDINVNHDINFGNIKDFLDKKDTIDYLNNCFFWNDTPEGYNYWDILDNKWNILQM